MRAILREWKDEIVGICAMLGVLVGVLGFGFTLYQLSKTTETLRAGNTYTIQKDGRELIEKLLVNREFRDAVTGTAAPKNETDVQEGLWRMFNFYLSVYRQSEANGLSRSVVNSFKKDFCEFVHLPKVGEYWKTLMATHRLGDDNAVMRKEWCND